MLIIRSIMIESATRLGHRWTIEPTGAWLGGLRRRIRDERWPERFHPLAMLACAVIRCTTLQLP